jgi:hypothetical protein
VFWGEGERERYETDTGERKERSRVKDDGAKEIVTAKIERELTI